MDKQKIYICKWVKYEREMNLPIIAPKGLLQKVENLKVYNDVKEAEKYIETMAEMEQTLFRDIISSFQRIDKWHIKIIIRNYLYEDYIEEIFYIEEMTVY